MGLTSQLPMRVFISAGEPSGDAIGASLLCALRKLSPRLEARGLGGALLVGAGLRVASGAPRDVAIMGAWELLARLPAMLRLRWRLQRLLRSWRPDVVVLIDYGGLNVGLAKVAARLKLPVVFLAPPKVWAWGRWRLPALRRAVSLILAPTTFEAQFFAKEGLNTVYVGHPLVDRLPSMLPVFERRGVALLPGSRVQEVRRILPAMLKTAAELHKRRPELRFELPLATPELRGLIEAMVAPLRLPINIVTRPGIETLASSRAALVASGTATLEAAATMTPSVVVYRLAPPTWWLARLLVTGIRHVSLPNILSGQEIFAEHLQALDPAGLADAVVACHDDGPFRHRILTQLELLRAQLGEPGVLHRAAQAVLALMQREGYDLEVPIPLSARGST